jgi:hypothetical protein
MLSRLPPATQGGWDGRRKKHLFGQQQVLVFKEKKEWLHLGGATKAPEVLLRYCMRGSRLAGLKERCAQGRMN